MIIWLYFLAIVCTEAITEIVTKSFLFEFFREWIAKKFPKSKISVWIICGHCFSVSAALVCTLSIFIFNNTGIPEIPKFLQIILITFFVHRMSNYLHFIVDRYFDKYYLKKEENPQNKKY